MATSRTTIGQLSERVTIQQPTASANSQSAAGPLSWSTLATVWALVRAAAGGERLNVGGTVAVHPYEVIVRYRADVTPQMRLSWTPFRAAAAKTLQILAVHPLDGRREFLMLTCAEAA